MAQARKFQNPLFRNLSSASFVVGAVVVGSGAFYRKEWFLGKQQSEKTKPAQVSDNDSTIIPTSNIDSEKESDA